MIRKPLDGVTGPVALAATLFGIALASQSFLFGAVLIALVTVFFRTSWWMPGAAALVLLAVAPVYAAFGDAHGANLLATLFVLLAALSLVHLAALERKSRRSGSGPS